MKVSCVSQYKSALHATRILLHLLIVLVAAHSFVPIGYEVGSFNRAFKSSPRLLVLSVISDNRRAGHEYEFTETFEAGIVLTGTEVKSCRKGLVQLSDALAEIVDGEVWLMNCHIAEHSRCGMRDNHKPKRSRKLLLNRKEILKLEQRVLQRNNEIIPLKMFFNDKNFVKVELGVGMKKSLGDKRDDVMKRDGEREIRRTMKGGYD